MNSFFLLILYNKLYCDEKILLPDISKEQFKKYQIQHKKQPVMTNSKNKANLRSKSIITNNADKFGSSSSLDINLSIKNNFIDNNDGTITDLYTGLMWEKAGTPRCLINPVIYIKTFSRLNFAGYNNWRLPTTEELISLLSDQRNGNCYLDPIFPKPYGCHYYSSDTSTNGRFWGIHFGQKKYLYPYSNKCFLVRAVRTTIK